MKHSRNSTTTTAIALALTFGACADGPTTPAAAPSEGSTPTATAATATGAAGALLQDASSRLLPALGQAKLRLELERHLDLLAAALEAEDTPRARRQLGLARKTIERQAKAGDVSDLAVLTLALDQIDEQLDARDADATPDQQ